jgi:hypothetical protein
MSRKMWIYGKNLRDDPGPTPKDYCYSLTMSDFVDHYIDLLKGRLLQSAHKLNPILARRYAEEVKEVITTVGIHQFVNANYFYILFMPLIKWVRRYIYRHEGINFNNKIDKMLIQNECCSQLLSHVFWINSYTFTCGSMYAEEAFWCVFKHFLMFPTLPRRLSIRLRTYMYFLACILEVPCVFVCDESDIESEWKIIQQVGAVMKDEEPLIGWIDRKNTRILHTAHNKKSDDKNDNYRRPYDLILKSYIACVTWEDYYKALEMGYIASPSYRTDRLELTFFDKAPTKHVFKLYYTRTKAGILQFLRGYRLIKDRWLSNTINAQYISQKIEPLTYIKYSRQHAFENIYKQTFLIKKKIDGLLHSIENSRLSGIYDKIERFSKNASFSYNAVNNNLLMFFTKPLIRDSCYSLYEEYTHIESNSPFEHTKMLKNNLIIMLNTKYDKYTYFSRYVLQHYKKQIICIVVESIVTLKEIDSILSRNSLSWYSYKDLSTEKSGIYILNVMDYMEAYREKRIKGHITIIGEYTSNIDMLNICSNTKGIFCKEDPFLLYPYTKITDNEWRSNSDIISVIQTRLWAIEWGKNVSLTRYYKHRKRYTDYACTYYYLKLLESDMQCLSVAKMRHIINSVHTILIQKSKAFTNNLENIYYVQTECMDILDSYIAYMLNHNVTNTLSTIYMNNKKYVLESEYMTNRLFNNYSKNSFNTLLVILFSHVVYTWRDQIINNKAYFYKHNAYKKYLIPSIYYRGIIDNIHIIRKHLYTYFLVNG